MGRQINFHLSSLSVNISLFFTIACWIFSKQYTAHREKGELCLIGSLVGSERGSGTGNLFFELINFIALAKQYKRVPVIRDSYTKRRLLELIPIFPNIQEVLPKSKVNCNREKRLVLRSSKCCVYEPNILLQNNLTNSVSLKVDFYYLQSYKYFLNDTSIDVPRILEGSRGVQNIAATELIDPKLLKRSKFNICIHIRRGDYLSSWRHEPTRREFTIEVAGYLNRKYKKLNPTTIVLGNDPVWAERILEGHNVHIAPFSPLNPPNVDWEFSRLYCDVVAITASASTYGWWLGYVSRGQKVYYNRKFSQPYGIEMELNADDFFPPQWTSLHLKHGQIYEV